MIKVNSIEFEYSKKKILDNISFDVNKGECIAILGNNGAGKSTMLKCLDKIIKPKNGAVFVGDKEIFKLSQKEIAKNIAYVAQKNEISRFTVFDIVLMGRKPYIKGNVKKTDIEIVEAVIKRMGIQNLSLRYIDELSGGEVQKVMLAKALAQEPKLLLLDEPTSNLDLNNQLEVLKNVKMIAKSKNIAVIIVIHDLNLALRYCDKFLFLDKREVYAYGNNEIVSKENIRNVYNVEVEIMKVNEVKVVIPIDNIN